MGVLVSIRSDNLSNNELQKVCPYILVEFSLADDEFHFPDNEHYDLSWFSEFPNVATESQNPDDVLSFLG